MTTYATGNPLGSTNPKDLKDNAENIDKFANGPAASYPDRFGGQRKSIQGMNAEFMADQISRANQYIAEKNAREVEFDASQKQKQDAFDAFILSSGYEDVGDYDDGPITLTERNQIFFKNGELWKASKSLALPYTTVENWSVDNPKFVSVGDAALRQELATINGAGYIGSNSGRGIQFDINNLQVLNINSYEQRNSRPMELIAHRGFATQFPQNTAMAFSTAKRNGADSIECDVAVSSDGVAYMFHDTTIDSLTTGTGTFTALSSSYIDGVELKFGVGTRISPIRVSRFSEFLEIGRVSGMFIYPELKRLRSDADIPMIIDMIEVAKVDHMCCVQSFSVSQLAVVRDLNKNVEVGALGSSTNISFLTGLIDTLAGLGKGVMLWDSTATLAVPQMVEYAFSKGVDWGVYVIDQNRYLAPIRKMGISRIMSNVSLKVEK